MPPAQLDLPNGAPSPSPSNTSTSKGIKRKWENQVAQAQAITPAAKATKERENRAPRDIVTQVDYTVRFLVEKKTPQTFHDIINYLSVQAADKEQLDKLRTVLQRDWHGARIEYDPRGANSEGTYKFKPKIPVKNAEELKGFFQKQDHCVGLKMEDLKDGWKEYSEEIERLEKKHEVLVVRNNKNNPRTIWQDDPSMNHDIGENLKTKWHEIRLPANPDDVRAKLQSAGLKPTSEPKRLSGASKPQEKKKKAARRGGRQTNTHMSSVLKDYSHMRK
jgi:transcription initiation factor TFIIE subunit beta